MTERKLFRESALVHLIAWWGVRVLSIQLPYELLFTNWEMNSPERWGVRLFRGALTVAIVLAWAHWRKVSWRDLGLGGPSFGRNLIIAVGGVVLLWLAIATIRGAELWAPQPIEYGLRIVMVVISAVDVMAQQLPTFGLLQHLGAQRLGTATAFVLGWLSFGIAHILLGSFLVGLVIGLAIGLVFGLLLWRTNNLGAGLGIHFGFYLMMAVLGFGAF